MNGVRIQYSIAGTSDKSKHKNLDDVTGNSFRIYEIINMKTTPFDSYDIIVDIKNQNLLINEHIDTSEFYNYKQRILSVLDLKKMIPIKDGVYTLAELDILPNLSVEDIQRRNLLQKEYNFCFKIRDSIETKANKTYEKQINTGKILKYHCNFKKLEEASDKYVVNNSPNDR